MTGQALSHFRCWLPTQLFAFLRLMDVEAIGGPAESVRPYGLCDYGRYARQDVGKPQCEVEWSRRLAKLLRGAGLSVETEARYPVTDDLPDSRLRCDLVLQLDQGQRLWVEVKGAWRSYWGGNSKIYRGYLLHPLVPGVDPKSHSVPLDLKKLSSLRPPQAHHIGQILIGFESLEDPMGEDVATLIRLAGLSSWQSASDSWVSPTTPTERVRCWFWWRAGDGWQLPLPPA